MGRGLRLACERCDYHADFYEQVPVVRDATGDPSRASGRSPAVEEVAVWRSYLCPECLEPVIRPDTDQLKPGAAPVHPCPHCGATLLDFETAARELAEASRTRVALDLRAEIAGRDQVEALLARASSLGADMRDGAIAHAAAVAALHDTLTEQINRAGGPEDRWAPLAETTVLAGLSAALAVAPDLAACTRLMEDRLLQAERHISSLEECVVEEAELPGVPCPRCGTAHLLHWPIWQ
jgi:DNA-directed RNA polymerase subunit RPC12/RpoP